MDRRMMTDTATPCPRGTKTRPCGMITVLPSGIAVCSHCQYRWSVAEVQAIRRAYGRRPRIARPTPMVQASLLGEGG